MGMVRLGRARAGLGRTGRAGQMQGKMVRADVLWAGQGNGLAGHCRARQGLMGRFAGKGNGWIWQVQGLGRAGQEHIGQDGQGRLQVGTASAGQASSWQEGQGKWAIELGKIGQGKDMVGQGRQAGPRGPAYGQLGMVRLGRARA